MVTTEELPAGSATEIRVALARIEERQEAGNHRIRNVDMKIDTLAVKLEKYAEKDDLEPLDSRVSSLEGTVKWVTRSLLAGLVSIVAGIYFLGKKIGLSP